MMGWVSCLVSSMLNAINSYQIVVLHGIFGLVVLLITFDIELEFYFSGGYNTTWPFKGLFLGLSLSLVNQPTYLTSICGMVLGFY